MTPDNILCLKPRCGPEPAAPNRPGLTGGGDLLSKGAEGVAEGLGSQVEQSLQEDVDLQRVEALALVWRRRRRQEKEKNEAKMLFKYENSLIFPAAEPQTATLQKPEPKAEANRRRLLGWGWAPL